MINEAVRMVKFTLLSFGLQDVFYIKVPYMAVPYVPWVDRWMPNSTIFR